MLDTIAVWPKDESSLEVADYTAGIALTHMLGEKYVKLGSNWLLKHLTRDDLEKWYREMIEEKERRRQFAATK